MTNTANTKQNLSPRTVIASAVLIATVGAVAIPASAGSYGNNRSYDNSTVDYARVVDVKPVVETYQVSNPVERCWDERITVREPIRDNRHYRNKSKTPEILGAIIGGVIGNQVGKRGRGKARDVATVAGAVLGGSVGRDVKHKNSRRYNDSGRYERTRYETVQRCEVKESYVTKEEVVGYDVSYKYRGQVFYTQMDQHPGDKIKVKVTVDPV